MSAIPLERDIEYPTSDGQPMAETPEHQQVMIDLILGLRRRYAEDADVWVGGNFFLCYEEGNPHAHVSPDVMVVRGVPKRKKRPNYLLWQEKRPTLVVEVTSKSTRRQDQGDKKDLYEQIGAEEFVLFDVFGEYLRPRLQGYILEGGRYRPLPLEEDGSLLSRTTGLLFKPEGERLRMADAATGELLLWPEEVEAARVREAAARQAAEAARQAAEERVRALEEELSRLRKGQSG